MNNADMDWTWNQDWVGPMDDEWDS